VENSKLTFNLQEIPEGRSSRTVHIGNDDLELNEEVVVLEKGKVEITFYKTDHFVEVKFKLEAETRLICDRSLRPFSKTLNGSYHLLFDPNVSESSETEKGAVRQIPADNLSVNIGIEVRDTIMLEIPARKVHPDYLDDEGNPAEFETKTFGPKNGDEDKIDPRWAELKKLKKN